MGTATLQFYFLLKILLFSLYVMNYSYWKSSSQSLTHKQFLITIYLTITTTVWLLEEDVLIALFAAPSPVVLHPRRSGRGGPPGGAAKCRQLIPVLLSVEIRHYHFFVFKGFSSSFRYFLFRSKMGPLVSYIVKLFTFSHTVLNLFNVEKFLWHLCIYIFINNCTVNK